MNEEKISKLKLYNKKYVKCEYCGFWCNRYDKKGNDYLGTECPECRLKKRLKESEIR